MKKICSVFLGGILLWTTCFSASADEAAIRVGSPKDSMYLPVWRAILEKAGLNVEHVIVPSGKRRDMFVRGDVLMDCCVAKYWRERPDEQEIQLFSEPFFYAIDYLVAHKNSRIKQLNLDQIKAYKMAIVFGYTYWKPGKFGTTIEAQNQPEAMEMVADGRADIIIVNQQEFRRLKNLHNLPLVLVGEHYRAPIHVRVHKDRADLMPLINEAIMALKSSQEILRILGKSIRKPSMQDK